MKNQNMLSKLQKKTLIPTQVAGYAATLLVGAAIVMLACQLYADIRPLLTQQTDIFRGHSVTLSKNVGVMQTVNKKGIYFTDKEVEELERQPWVEHVARFASSAFHAKASIAFGGQGIYTDLFFEGVPDRYVDVQSEAWRWDSTESFIPVIIPEDYLNLYNFGFAESQSLPVIAKGTVEQVQFAVTLSGRGKSRTFRSRIVGFSGKINTILAPEDFIGWANREFGEAENSAASRLLVELGDASDERIPRFMEEHRYNVKQDELENSKMVFFFRVAMVFLIAVAMIIIVLSVAFIIMSLNVIVQKNRDLYRNLYAIGYSPRQIARFYRRTVGIITVADLAVAMAVAMVLRSWYVGRLATMFAIEWSAWPIAATTAILAVALVAAYDRIVLHTIRKTVEN
ncbi:MAG: hypothetical protein IJ745_05230 [Bacteroidales bacterium]|nr:hypothetical protein [Bacteroidales bacterium]